MIERTKQSTITFAHPFILASWPTPLAAGTYRLTVDEELIEGLSFTAYRRTGTHLEVPSIGTVGGERQCVTVGAQELDAAIAGDRQSSPISG
jgi:hypothetical protein